MTEKNLATSAIVLFFMWLIFSGIMDFTFIMLGVISILVVLFISKKAFKASKSNLFNQLDFSKFLLFLPKQLLEIIKSNFHVLLVIISKRINPQLIIIKNTTKTEIGEYILAMAITLTPGSLIVEYNKEELLIHVIDNTSKQSVLSLHLNKLVEKIENKHADDVL